MYTEVNTTEVRHRKKEPPGTWHAVLLAVDLPLLFPRELTPVGLVAGAHLVVDSGLALSEFGRLGGRQLARLHALRDALLLLFLARLDAPFLRGGRRRPRLGPQERRGHRRGVR